MQIKNRYSFLLLLCLCLGSCSEDYLDLEPRGTILEPNFYQTEEEIFQALVATYDVLQWGGTSNQWSMLLGLTNTASDDCYAGGSDASDQPNWVAWDAFTLNPTLGPQEALWNKYYAGIYRANLLLEKIAPLDDLNPDFVARVIAETKFLRAYYYFDLVRLFGNVPLIITTLGADAIEEQVQARPEEVYAQIEKDLQEAKGTFQLPQTVPPDELGRITQGAVASLFGKVILYQNDNARMLEAANLFGEVIESNNYFLEENFGDIFSLDNEFGPESIFEIQYSGNQRGGWENFINGTEGNYSVQFFGMRDYVGPTFATGWSFCPVSLELADAMQGDPRFEHTIIDGQALISQGAQYSPGFQNTDYFIRKYAGLQEQRPNDGEPALNWSHNIRDIRLADVLLMAAEALVRGGGDEGLARNYLNQVRERVELPEVNSGGSELLEAIYTERRLELATEGHRFFDLVRTGRAADVLPGFIAGTHQWLPIPQIERDLTDNRFEQNPGY
ncbi:MAG: RagB/SusD family nutrient uptake outer membrane protein [Bacteroidota bacterium]